jgi:hypothetical protein
MSQNGVRMIRVFVAASCLAGMLLLSGHLASAQEPDKEQNKAPAPAASTSPVATTLSRVVAAGLSGEETDQDPSESPDDQTGTGQGQTVATLNSDHMIAMKDIVRNHLLYGVSFTERIAGTNLSRGSLNIWNPYLGFLGRLGRTKYVLQYAPTISKRWLEDGGPRAYHSTSLFLTRELSRKWEAGFGVNSGFGEYGLSLTQDNFRPVSGVPVIDPIVIQPGLTETILNVAELNLRWRPTQRRSFSFSTSEVYRNAVHLGHNNLATTRVHFDQTLSRRTAFLAYGEAGKNFNLVPCTTYGGGAGVLMKMSRSTSLRVTVGPEFASGGCPTRKDIKTNAALVIPYGTRSSLYIAFDRDFNNLFVSPQVQSRDSIAGGFHKSTARGTSLRVDLGYYDVRQCCGQASFHSFFASPVFSWPIVRTLTFVADYRFFSDKEINQLAFGRNQFLLTLQWKPKSARESR